MPAVLKLFVCNDDVRVTSRALFRRSTRWLLKPMSPRRYQPPKSSTTGAGAYAGGGAIAMSAANAAWDNNVAAPAAMKDLTLRMGFVLCPVRPSAKSPTSKTHGGTMALNA